MSWNEPNGKDAFNLSWISVLLTLLAAIGGLVFYVVSSYKSSSEQLSFIFIHSYYLLSAHDKGNWIRFVLGFWSRELRRFYEFSGRSVAVLLVGSSK